MKLVPNRVYHIYNRGNNRQKIFFEPENYYYFLKKVKAYLAPNCDIINYCLMPNHFHFLIKANKRSVLPHKFSKEPSARRKDRHPKRLTQFSWGLKQLLSSYTKGINKRYGRTGSVFQQNTRCKQTSSDFLMDDYSLWCFIYIHNNPKMAGLVNSPEEYEFSSFKDYLGLRNDSCCNVELGMELLCLDKTDLFECKCEEVPTVVLKSIF